MTGLWFLLDSQANTEQRGTRNDISNTREVYSRPRPRTQEFKLNLPLNVTLDEDRGVELAWVYDKRHIIMRVKQDLL